MIFPTATATPTATSSLPFMCSLWNLIVASGRVQRHSATQRVARRGPPQKFKAWPAGWATDNRQHVAPIYVWSGHPLPHCSPNSFSFSSSSWLPFPSPTPSTPSAIRGVSGPSAAHHPQSAFLGSFINNVCCCCRLLFALFATCLLLCFCYCTTQ